MGWNVSNILVNESIANKKSGGGSGGGSASYVTYDNSTSHLTASNVQAALDEVVENFQAGVDSVYDACVAKGSTPASHSLSDVITAIGAIPTGGKTQVNPFGSAQTVTLYDANGVTVTSSSIDSSGTMGLVASEAQAGYEGFVIDLDVTAGHLYLLEFDFQVDSSSKWAGTSYRFGYELANTADTNYTAQNVPENLPRDYLKNYCADSIIPTGSKAYVNFNVCGFSDEQANAFTISDFKLYDLGSASPTNSTRKKRGK